MIKNIRQISSALVIWVAMGCSYSRTTEDKKIAQDWISVLNRHDTTALGNFYDDSVTIESPNWEGKKKGIKEVKMTYGRYFTSTPDLQQEITLITATDSVLVLEYLSRGTLKNLEKDIPDYMKDKKYTLQNCTRMIIRNGKIVDQKTYFDQVAFLRQVGFFDQR
ncbi:MAG: nuclear transport factor 2 family protein [Chitinophagales bacterium]